MQLRKKLQIAMENTEMLVGGGTREGGLLTNLENLLRGDALLQCEAEKNELRKRALGDITIIEADRVQRLKSHEAAISSYNNSVHVSRTKLRENYVQQDAVWKQIEGLFEQYHELCDEARRMTQLTTEVTEKEHKRRKEHEEYRESYAKHREQLDLLVKSCDAAIDFVKECGAYLERGKERVLAMRVEEKLKNILSCEHRQMREAFTEWGAHVAIMQHRVDRRILGLQLQREAVAFQRKHAASLVDNNIADYNKRLIEIDNLLAVLHQKRTARQEDYDAGEAAFLRVDGNIEDQDDDPIDHHPAVRTKQLFANNFKKLMDDVASATEVEQTVHKLSKSACEALDQALRELEERIVSSRKGTKM